MSERQPSEGVRIIKAEEAQAALDAGEAAGRRPGDQLKFGDVPPAPTGPRPAHRFPLPDSVDPAQAVALPPLAPRRPGADHPADFDAPQAAQDPHAAQGDEELEAEAPPWAVPAMPDRTTEMGVPEIPEEGITLSGAPPEMPHWSDPPTGEVPRLRFDEPAGEGESGDDMEAWRALGARGVRWRDEDDWGDSDELSDLMSDDEPVGALDQTRTEHSDLYSFDEDFERVASNRTGSHPVVDLTREEAPEPQEAPEEAWATVDSGPRQPRAARGGRAARGRRGSHVAPPPVVPTVAAAAAAGAAATGAATTGEARRARAATDTTPRPARPTPRSAPRPPAAGNGGDVGSRIVIGVVLLVLLAIAYAVGAKALLALSVVVVVASVAEAYNMTRGPGFRPATFLGLVATVGCVLGAYWKGIGAISVVTVLLFAGTMLWYVIGVVEARPLANAAVTVMVFVWVSVLGSFSGVLLQKPHGKGLFLGAVLVAVAADVCAFGVGRWIGSRPMAPNISPHKTVEGFIGGLVGAMIVGAIVGKTVHPWSGVRYGLILGLVVGLIAPAGDLFESMLKRDLQIKDSGSILGGHGGLLDRFDGILLALPAAYFVATIAFPHL